MRDDYIGRLNWTREWWLCFWYALLFNERLPNNRIKAMTKKRMQSIMETTQILPNSRLNTRRTKRSIWRSDTGITRSAINSHSRTKARTRWSWNSAKCTSISQAVVCSTYVWEINESSRTWTCSRNQVDSSRMMNMWNSATSTGRSSSKTSHALLHSLMANSSLPSKKPLPITRLFKASFSTPVASIVILFLSFTLPTNTHIIVNNNNNNNITSIINEIKFKVIDPINTKWWKLLCRNGLRRSDVVQG